MTEGEYHCDPFANMYLQENPTTPVIPINPVYQNEQLDGSDAVQTENSETLLFSEDDAMLPTYQNDIIDENEEEDIKPEKSTSESFDEEPKVVRKKGRPKGSFKNTVPVVKPVKTSKPGNPGPKPARPYQARKLKVSIDGEQQAHERIPKMRQNVSILKLTNEQIEDLKKDGRSFCQPGVCYIIAPQLAKCIECLKKTDRKRRQTREVDCRFYHFRKLRYEGDELVVVGFLDPTDDPKEVDRSIWVPQPDKLKFKSLSVANARLIIAHVGDELCRIMAKERSYYEQYKSESKPIIWKRLIDGVLEMCDLCNTTLFNFHLICTSCGLTLCIDCANEENPNLADTVCSKNKEEHSYNELFLTQIIVGDCMDILQRTLHDICNYHKIIHECKFKTEPILEIDRVKDNIIRSMINDDGTLIKTFLNREPINLYKHMEVDIGTVKYEDSDVNIFNEVPLIKRPPKQPRHIRPDRYFAKNGRETVLSVSRVMSQSTSDIFYKDVPHKWLCENKLLRLLDPTHPRNEEFFAEQWQRGQPVLISNVLEKLDKKLWLPQSFSNEFGDEKSDFINCMTGNLVRNKEIAVFWDGFEIVEKRLRDNEGKPMLLKLKDWPPETDFKKIMPSRFEDIMKNLPMNPYTNRTGDLNIVKYLPQCFLHPDLGPKGYFAYGSPYYLKEGTTNLHLDISDACNVMCYIGFPRDKNISVDEYVEQGFRAIIEGDCDLANIDRVTKDGEIPGALWHIYEACDADKIRDFLIKIASEKGFKIAKDHDVIHDQNWYIDGELRNRLHSEYGVKGYAFVQFLGDTVILPAGTPHQVRNIYSCIKIAEDFVSPQQMPHCLHLSEEFRKLTKQFDTSG
ncbi:hypothetical protein ACKWTF_006747 [Chironomus riparius]